MFKRGEIVTVSWVGARRSCAAIVEKTPHPGSVTLWPTDDGRRHTVSESIVTPYTGPPYEKDGRRFVAEEFREIKTGDFYLSCHDQGKRQIHKAGDYGPNRDIDNGWRIALLPVPELEHEFKVGDWIRNHNGDVAKIKRLGVYSGEDTGIEWDADVIKSGQSYLKSCTKLPGRPLTTDDLMLVLSGVKVMVECHACGCEGVRDKIIAKLGECFDDIVFFYHGEYNEKSINIARISNGSIVFADSVEGSIYVVDE